MKFCVCIKQVPDVAAPIQVRDGELVFDTGRMVLNAYDASAVEAALVLTEQHGGEVEVVLVGPEKASETLRKALAMGAERGTHLVVDAPEALDAPAYARLLADFFAERSYDAVLCGKQAQDTDAGLTGAMLAELLSLPYTTNAVGLTAEPDAGALVVTRQGDAGQEILALPTPCLVTCSNDMNDPRIPSLKGIMNAKRKTIDTRKVSPEAIPAAATQVVRFEPMPERAAGRKFEGAPEEVVPEVVRLLSAEAKAI